MYIYVYYMYVSFITMRMSSTIQVPDYIFQAYRILLMQEG